MTGVGVAQASALWVEDGVEAGDERARGYLRDQRLVDASQNLSRRLQRLNDGPQHAASRGHYQGCGHAMTGSVPHYQPEATARKFQEVVEVSSHLPSRSVVGRYPPAVEFGRRLGQELLLDPAGDLQLLLDALPLSGFRCPKAPGQVSDQGVVEGLGDVLWTGIGRG